METDTSAGGDGARKRRRCEQPAVDLLSALPDSLLLHILSFLQMVDAVQTALLSRRWRHLWTSTPSLDFSWTSTGRRGSGFIDWALVLHGSAKVRVFRAVPNLYEEGKYNEEGKYYEQGKYYEVAELAKMVDSWVRFAINRGVEELDLQCWGMGYSRDRYGLPGSVFTCESLVSLTLQCCHLDLPSRIFMRSLKFLTLNGVAIVDGNLEDLLFGCPSLEHLTVQDCPELLSLDICDDRAESRLVTLELCGNSFQNWIYVSDPSVKTLVMNGVFFIPHFRELSSIVNASLDFTRTLQEDFRGADLRCLERLLSGLRHVRALKLCSWCVQVLSFRASESSQLSSEFSVVSLELAIGFLTLEFAGIFHALRSFKNLEFLTIDILYVHDRITLREDSIEWDYFTGQAISEYYYDETKYVMSNERSSPTMLQHLKTVSIFGLVRAICADNKAEHATVQNGLEFIKFLLKNSPVLERLTLISTTGKVNKLTNKKSEVLLRFVSGLQALPRASPYASVIIQDK